MNRLLSSKSLLAVVIAFGGLAAASAAQARTDVAVSVAFHAPYVQTAPAYVHPAPAYVQPNVEYGRAPHRGWYERRGAWGDADRDGVPNMYDRDSRFYRRHASYRWGPWGDYDHDGVPNRYDRAPANPYRR